MNIKCGQPAQIFEQPTQRLMISCLVETEAKQAHKHERDHDAVL